MSDLIRKERFLGGEKIIVGDKRTDIILETLGKVYIKAGNSSRLLNEIISTVDKLSKEDINSIILLEPEQPISDLEYPGDGKLIYDGKILYLSIENNYIPLVDKEEGNNYVKKSGDTMSGQLTIQLDNDSIPPIIVNSSVLVEGLNSEFVGGEKLDNYTNKVKNESISGKWEFNDLRASNIVTSSVTSSTAFSPGLTGYGWQISDNTLTIDNVIIRKALTILDKVEDLYIARINSTNSNLWLNNSITIVETNSIEVIESSILEKTTSTGIKNVYFLGINNIYEELLCSGFDGTGAPLEEAGTKVDLETTTGILYNFYDYFQGNFYCIHFNGTAPNINDILRCQLTNSIKTRYYDCIVTNILNSDCIIVRCSETVNDVYIKNGQKIKNNLSKNIFEEEEILEGNYIESPAKEDTLVVIGNISTGLTGVYLSTIDDYSPSIYILEKVTTPDYQIQDTLNSKLGNLEGISDQDMLIEGVGLYTKNLNARSKNWIISNGIIKYTGGNGLLLNNSGLIDVVTPSTSPFSIQVEDYIKNVIIGELTNIVSSLSLEVSTLKLQVTSLEDRVATLEGLHR